MDGNDRDRRQPGQPVRRSPFDAITEDEASPDEDAFREDD
jgi:hypothetical protein